MLVPFVIDAESLIPDPAWTPSVVRSCHQDLLDLWQRMGLVVHAGQSFENSSLRQAVEKLPQKLRMLWQAQLERSPPVPCGNGWGGAVAPSNVEDICAIASLALVDDVRAEADFDMDEDQDEISISPGGDDRLIISRLIAVNNASVIRKALDISQKNIQSKESHQDIWDTRFRSLASASSPTFKNVSIVDRYLMERHFRAKNSVSALERFLRLLDGDAGGPRRVTIYSAWTDHFIDEKFKPDDVKEGIDAVLYGLENRNVERIKVHMAKNQSFRKYAHDRYVRFGRFVWELGRGLEIFEGPGVAHLCQASFKSDAQSHLRVEQALEREAERPPIIVRR